MGNTIATTQNAAPVPAASNAEIVASSHGARSHTHPRPPANASPPVCPGLTARPPDSTTRPSSSAAAPSIPKRRPAPKQHDAFNDKSYRPPYWNRTGYLKKFTHYLGKFFRKLPNIFSFSWWIGAGNTKGSSTATPSVFRKIINFFSFKGWGEETPPPTPSGSMSSRMSSISLISRSSNTTDVSRATDTDVFSRLLIYSTSVSSHSTGEETQDCASPSPQNIDDTPSFIDVIKSYLLCYIGKHRARYQCAWAVRTARNDFSAKYAVFIKSLVKVQRDLEQQVQASADLHSALLARHAWQAQQQTFAELLRQESAAGYPGAPPQTGTLEVGGFPHGLIFFDLCKARQVLSDAKKGKNDLISLCQNPEAAPFIDETLAALQARIVRWQGRSKIKKRAEIYTQLYSFLWNTSAAPPHLAPQILLTLRQASRLYRLRSENESRFLYNFFNNMSRNKTVSQNSYRDLLLLRAKIAIYQTPHVIGWKIAGEKVLKKMRWRDLIPLYFFTSTLNKQLEKIMEEHLARHAQRKVRRQKIRQARRAALGPRKMSSSSDTS